MTQVHSTGGRRKESRLWYSVVADRYYYAQYNQETEYVNIGSGKMIPMLHHQHLHPREILTLLATGNGLNCWHREGEGKEFVKHLISFLRKRNKDELIYKGE